MWGAGVRGVMLAGFPDFVEEEGAGLIDTAVQIESQAAYFLAGGYEKGAKLGFEERVLPFFGAEDNDQGDCALGKLGGSCGARVAAGAELGNFAGFSFGHVGGDCTPNSVNRKENRNAGRSPNPVRAARFAWW